MTRREPESGATILEVIIALLLLAAVASAVAMASVGGASLRNVSRLQVAMTAAGEQAQEDVANDREWMRAGCDRIDVPCDIGRFVRTESLMLTELEPGARAELVGASAVPLDSELDGLAGSPGGDRDGVLPDYYRITIELQLPREIRARYPIGRGTGRRVFVTTMDRRGAEQVGSVAVEVCRVTNQADERMQVQGCAPSGRTDVRMDGCARYERVPSPGIGNVTAHCRSAFDWVSGYGPSVNDPAPFVSMERQPVTFRLVDASTGVSWSSAGARRIDGLYVFENVPAGQFELRGLPASVGGTTERWKTKEIPGFHGSTAQPTTRPTLNVEPGVRARALVMFRPGTTARGIDQRFERRTHNFRMNGRFWTGWETAVAPYYPTDTYMGSSAEEMCEYLGRDGGGYKSSKYAQETYRCAELRPGPKHCVTAIMGGLMMDQVAPGRGDYIGASDGMGAQAVEVATMLEGGATMEELIETFEYWYVLRSVAGRKAGEFCTFYAEYYRHQYYGMPTKRPIIRPGAVEGTTYKVTPMPVARHLEFDGVGAFEEVPTCANRSRDASGGCLPGRFGFPQLAAGLKPGLNTGIVQTDPRKAARNENLIPAPAWTRAPIWVKPNGAIVPKSGGLVAPGPRFTVRGEGECYWEGNGIAGELESATCKPCDPVWRTGLQYRDRCSLLLRTEWRRPAWERSRSCNWWDPGGCYAWGRYVPIEPKQGSFNFDPPWGCTGRQPDMAPAATCFEPAVGGGGGGAPVIDETRHRDSTGGHGVVARRRMGGRT